MKKRKVIEIGRLLANKKIMTLEDVEIYADKLERDFTIIDNLEWCGLTDEEVNLWFENKWRW